VTTAVLFDLGNTLAAYYRRDEFAPILERAIASARQYLLAAGYEVAPLHMALAKATAENREAPDFRFTPMADRLARIFDVGDETRAGFDEALCERFLEPIFAVGCAYPDAHATLERLRRAGHRIAIVSNAPWGSPPALWRKELARLGFAELVDAVVLCGDVGWRKPSKRIFDHACERLGVTSGDCTFVGDELDWDVAGSTAAGMRPVLIDRDGRHAGFPGARIRSLSDLLALLPELGTTI
jgi:putative hydrolase of the HAD superfamily